MRVWDIVTGQELLCLTDCKARVNAVAFSPDGTLWPPPITPARSLSGGLGLRIDRENRCPTWQWE